MTSAWTTSFTVSGDASDAASTYNSLLLSTATSLYHDACEGSDTAEVLGRLNYLRVPRPAPCLAIPPFQRSGFTLSVPRATPRCDTMDTPAAESIWTPFGLPQSSCGISFVNARTDSDGMSPSAKDLLSMASVDQTGESFIVEAINTPSVTNQPLGAASILTSASPTKKSPGQASLIDDENAQSLSGGSCGGSALDAVRHLRRTPTPPAAPQPHPPPVLLRRSMHARVTEPYLRRPSHHLKSRAEEKAAAAGTPLGRRDRVTHTGMPSFTAQTPAYAAMLNQSRGRRLPRGPAFFPAWSARYNVVRPMPEEVFDEDSFSTVSDVSGGAPHCVVGQQPTR